jgi:hypothetical protein
MQQWSILLLPQEKDLVAAVAEKIRRKMAK